MDVFWQGTLLRAANCCGIASRAKTENGPPTPACWASTSWVRNRNYSFCHICDRKWKWRWWLCGCGPPGVWLEGSDGTDINALCRSHSERMVAVADDFCKVHLFQYPCPKPKVNLIAGLLWLPSHAQQILFFNCLRKIKCNLKLSITIWKSNSSIRHVKHSQPSWRLWMATFHFSNDLRTMFPESTLDHHWAASTLPSSRDSRSDLVF